MVSPTHTVFSPTFRLLQVFVEASGHHAPLAYFHPNWRRDAAPLLDHMGAVIDHVEAFATGGEHGEANFVTACNKCNARKNSRPLRHISVSAPENRSRDGLVNQSTGMGLLPCSWCWLAVELA